MTRDQVDVAVDWWASQLVGSRGDATIVFRLALEDAIYQLLPEVLTTSAGQPSKALLESLEDAGLSAQNLPPYRTMDLTNGKVLVCIDEEGWTKLYPV